MRITSRPGPRGLSTEARSRFATGRPRPSRRWLTAACLAASLPLNSPTGRAAGDAPTAPTGRGEVPQVASRSTTPATTLAPTLGDEVTRAHEAIAGCQKRFARVRDYTCTFVKRER